MKLSIALIEQSIEQALDSDVEDDAATPGVQRISVVAIKAADLQSIIEAVKDAHALAVAPSKLAGDDWVAKHDHLFTT